MQNIREYRNLQGFENKPDYIIEGYACLWEPYLYYESDGVKVYERVDPHAFDNADMNDVVFRAEHQGRVFSRTSNGTLTYKIDSKGLWIRADLSRTEAGKELHNEIAQGMYKSMSWAFVIEDQNGDAFDTATRTRHIKKVKKVYDVAVCAHCANENTSVFARSQEHAQDYFTGVVKPSLVQELNERQAIEQRNAAIETYLKNIRKVVKK